MTSLYFFGLFYDKYDLEIDLAFDLHLTHTDYLKITFLFYVFQIAMKYIPGEMATVDSMY